MQTCGTDNESLVKIEMEEEKCVVWWFKHD